MILSVCRNCDHVCNAPLLSSTPLNGMLFLLFVPVILFLQWVPYTLGNTEIVNFDKSLAESPDMSFDW